MRQKTDEKKQQIIQSAVELFAEKGLETVSMEDVAEHAGCSKATVYNYFKSKEELFSDVVIDSAHQILEEVVSVKLNQSLLLIEKLRILCVKYLKFGLSDEIIAFRRNGLIYLRAEKQGGKGREAYTRTIRGIWGPVADFLESSMKNGDIKTTDPWFATTQLRFLIELDLAERKMLNLAPKISAKEIERNVDRGLDLFMEYYENKAKKHM